MSLDNQYKQKEILYLFYIPLSAIQMQPGMLPAFFGKLCLLECQINNAWICSKAIPSDFSRY